MTTENAPAFFAYTVHTLEGRDVWEKIGAAWSHSEGKDGLNVLLTKSPARDASGRLKIVLRAARSQEAGNREEAPADAPTPHALRVGGGACASCNGRGVVVHATRGPMPCRDCRGGVAGA